MRQIRAIRALRVNYRWRGVCVWLRSTVRIPGHGEDRGWRWVLLRPTTVRNFMEAVADGVIF